VSIDHVVQAEKVPRTPPNQDTATVVGHGLDFDIFRRESRDGEQELVASCSGEEMSGGPWEEFSKGNRLADLHGCDLSGGDARSSYYLAKNAAGSSILIEPR
jgi:hypothetical protein